MSTREFIAARQSLLIALGLALLLTAWLLSGRFGDGTETAVAVDTPVREPLTRVRVAQLEARRISQEIVINGHTEPARAVSLRAEVDGRVVELGAARGMPIRQGALVARIDLRDRQARLKQAEANVEQRRIEFEASRTLQQRNLQSETLLAQARANLSAAEAEVELIAIEIANTTLRAPFDGILDRRPVEIGTFVKAGDEMARIIDHDPMRVVASVTQQDRHRLVLGDRGVARLITGQVVTGQVRYIASEADQATRTFRVELEVPNPDGALVSGLTAQISIPVRTLTAHQVSPALLTQQRGDAIGIKAVDDQGTVVFHAVEVIRSTTDGLWVAGLPAGARVITVGQGFVQPGDRVNPIPAEQVGEPSSRPAAAP